MKLGLRIAVASAALAVLVPGAFAQGGAPPRLTESPTSGFPDKAYIVGLDRTRPLTAAQVTVTENGGPVIGVAVQAPGGSRSGAGLLIDASNSMKGAPIQNATVAARAFLEERKQDLPVAIVTFNPQIDVLSDFTTNSTELATSVSTVPQTAEGTHIYDALIEASNLAKAQGLERVTFVLLSDGANFDTSNSTLDEALAAANEANARVISIGLDSPQYTPETLQTLAKKTNGQYIVATSPGALEKIYTEIGQQLSSEYEVTYRSLQPASTKTVVAMTVAGSAPATATYTTPALDLTPQGTFDSNFADSVITSPWLMIFVIIAVLALIAFAIFSAVDVRNRSLRRRMAQYVTVPSEEESRLRRAEVSAMLADTAHSAVKGRRWWQRFESDVELAGFGLSPLAIAGWTIIGGILGSIAAAFIFQSLWGLLAGLAAPFVTRFIVGRRVSKMRKAFEEQLADNLDVLAGAMRTGHSTMGALSVMADSAIEPSKTEFRRVLQDEQLGVALDDALMVMARRMQSYDGEQVALVMRLQREAGGNTAEVLDRVAEVIRGRMELRRLVEVLTAQARISRWILTGLPIFVLVALIFTGGDYLDPMLSSLVGKLALVAGAFMVAIGSLWIKQIAKMDV